MLQKTMSQRREKREKIDLQDIEELYLRRKANLLNEKGVLYVTNRLIN